MRCRPPHRDLSRRWAAKASNWIGQAPFTSEQHIFQNLGDGTYTIPACWRSAPASRAGINITYKILYNDAVAMTGGQPVEGHSTSPQIAHQVAPRASSGSPWSRTSPDKYPAGNDFPPGTTIHHRDELDAVQRELRESRASPS